MNTPMFHLNLSDWQKAFVMAVLGGIFLPLDVVVQAHGFSIATANWGELGIIAANGAVVSGVGYLVKNFFSDQNGQVLGHIG